MYHSLRQQIIPEWKTMYINLKILRKSIKGIEFTNSIKPNSSKTFSKAVELEKYSKFKSSIEARLVYLEFKYTNNYQIENNSNNEKEKKAFLLLYKECVLLERFCDLNHKIYHYYLEKARKTFSHILTEEQIGLMDEDLRNETTEKVLAMFTPNIGDIKKIAKTSFLNLFDNHEKFKGEMILEQICKESNYSIMTVFFLGFWIGGICLTILLIFIFTLITNSTPEADIEYQLVFPIFRGSMLLIVYFWMLSWNVWGWTHHHINYRKIFQFNSHYSQLQEILRRCAFFTSVQLICFSIFLYIPFTSHSKENKQNYWLSNLPAIISWIFMIGYLIFPSNKIFNWEGRKYVLGQFQRILMFWQYEITFPIIWFSDQLISLVKPIQDFEYSICYYSHNINLIENKNVCLPSNKLVTGLIISAFPLFLRMIQCGLLCHNKNTLRGPDFLNFMKYLITFIVCLTSYLYKYYPLMIYAWLLFGIVSSIYSFLWDIKMDWGIVNAKFLRKEQQSSSPNMYYLAIIFNFIFRLVWTLTFSQTILDSFDGFPEIFPMLIGLIEIIRRAIWNFFRVEKEHRVNCEKLEAVEEEQLNDLSPFMNPENPDISMETTDPEHIHKSDFKRKTELFRDEFQHKLDEAKKARELSSRIVHKIKIN